VVGSGQSGNYIKAAEIIAAFNDDGSTQIKLAADHLDFDGLLAEFQTANVTMNQLTVFGGIVCDSSGIGSDGDISTQGWLSATDGVKINGTELNPVNSISLSGPTNNQYTLSYTDLGGTSHAVGSFSRAVSSFAGTWTGGRLDVLASPQAQHYYDWIKGGTASWSGTTATVDILHSTTPQTEQSFTSTGQNVTVNVASKLEAGSGGPSPTPYTPSTGNIGFSSFTVTGGFDMSKLAISYAGDSSGGALTKEIGRISGGLYITYDGVDYGKLRDMNISCSKVYSVSVVGSTATVRYENVNTGPRTDSFSV
jgi:hypothetical protein